MRAEKEGLARAAFASVEFELFDLLAEELEDGGAAHFVGDIKGEHVNGPPFVEP